MTPDRAADDRVLRLLEEGRRLARSSDRSATGIYERVLIEDDACVEAHVFLARAALSTGDANAAVAHMRQACASEPTNAQLWKSLAIAAIAIGADDVAVDALERAIDIAPEMSLAHLQLGKLRERQGDRYRATRAYFRAILQAQLAEQWLDADSIPVPVRDDVLHAMAFVREHRVAVLAGLLDPMRERFGRAALQRIERGLSGYLGIEPLAMHDPLQRPKFFHIPDLSTGPFLRREDLPWIERLEAAFGAIREEAASAIADTSALTSFLDSDDGIDEYLAGDGVPPHWDAVFFYRHGKPFAESTTRYPATSRVLEALPLVKIEGHAPEICFSVLSPGSHILPHHGVSNLRVVVHLPLIVPRDCVLRVAGQDHVWKEGQCVVFDDTYLHEAWNRSDRTRVVLLMDAWHPGITEAERIALTGLIEGIGDFHRG